MARPGGSHRAEAGFTAPTASLHGDRHARGVGHGHVTIIVSNMVWYVQNNAAAHTTAVGSPFNTLASAESATGSAAGDFIYVFKGDGTNRPERRDHAEEQPDAAQREVRPRRRRHTLATGTPADRPMIGNGAGSGVTLASGDTVKGFDITGTGAGTFAIAGGTGDAPGRSPTTSCTAPPAPVG